MAWNTNGNAGTQPNDFLGTTDAKPLAVRTKNVEAARVTEDGKVGIGTKQPQNALHVGNGQSTILPSRVNAVVASNTPDAGIAIAQQNGVNVLLQASGAGGYIGTTSNHPLVLRTGDQDRMAILPSGDVQIGNGASSIAPSRVNAFVTSREPDAGIAIAQQNGVNVLLQASGAGGYIGTTSNHPLVLRTGDRDRVVVDTAGNLTVTGDVLLANADCAEDFDLTDDAEAEPGTVMVVADDGRLRHCEDAYDRRVAGVISGAGSYRPAIVLDRHGAEGRRAISLIGKVYCRVDATRPIAVGDLLTTSATPGHAMAATDPARAFGAVLGKALRPLRHGVGLIPVLIALQ